METDATTTTASPSSEPTTPTNSKKTGQQPSKLVKLAMEVDAENLMLKLKNAALTDKVASLEKSVSLLEKMVKEYDPSFESVASLPSSSIPKKAGDFHQVSILLFFFFLVVLLFVGLID